MESLGLTSDDLGEVEQTDRVAIHLNIDLGKVESKLTTVKKTSMLGQLIDNYNPYQGNPSILPHKSRYPIIFEPIQNVKFSRSVYKITSFLDFTPYVGFFEWY